MEFIKLTHENIESEHICCAISNNNDIQVKSKKSWLDSRLDEGLIFLKANVRGKCFIEYIPAEKAWAPICADGYMYIDCLWVSGQFKGHGYSNLLMEQCINDSKQKGKKGIVVLSSVKKMGFLADIKYFTYKGFTIADTAEPYFQLLYLPFNKDYERPQFKSCVRQNEKMGTGFTVFYTNQCPFTAKYVPLLQKIATINNVEFNIEHINTTQKAQNVSSPFTTFSLFYNGKFVTHEIPSEKKFQTIINKLKI